jgi:signal transduction histidine kinase
MIVKAMMTTMREWLRAGQQRPAWQTYGGAAAVTLLVVAGRLALDPLWGRQHNRHLVFLPTVMLAAWFGGFGPGLLATAISTTALAWFWSEPSPGVGLHTHFDLVLFLLISVAICALIQSLRVERARADAARQSRERVLAVVAHDLRNPLSAVKTAADAIKAAGTDAAAVARRVKIVERATGRMDDLIRDLVSAERIEHGELPVERHAEDARAMVQDLMELNALAASDARITLRAEVADSGDLTVWCDRHRLLQVLGNLVGNALKFTPQGGHVTVRVRPEPPGGAALLFVVEDSGPGIRPEQMPHLFERYWSGDSRGVGLGLFIARSIVRAHGGDIEVRSEPGMGATFSFTVPRPPRPLDTGPQMK